MEIVIKETGKIEELLLIDRKTNTDWFNDLVGNHNGFGEDPSRSFVEERNEDIHTGRFITSEDNFLWWQNVVAEIDLVNIRIENLRKEFGSEKVDDVIRNANYGHTDLEYYASSLHQCLDEEFGELTSK